MIPIETKNPVTTGGGETLDTAGYTINPDNIVHITQILRNMYSDPLKAVFREYYSNAVDAHQQAGVTRPIEITLPTSLSPSFIVRDFGGGLSVEDTKSLLYSYGSSGEEKRKSNDQIGAFGIGCKCAFAIADAFTYTVWFEGTKSVWSCFLDEHDAGQASLVHQAPADLGEEPSGIEVNIPVPSHYHYKVQETLKGVLKWHSTMPVVHGIEAAETPAVIKPAVSQRFGITINGNTQTIVAELYEPKNHTSSNPHLILGYDGYMVQLSQLELARGTADRVSGRDYKFVFRAPIGLVQLAPNREEIQYSGYTKKVLKAVVEAAYSDEFLLNLSEKALAQAEGKPIRQQAMLLDIAGSNKHNEFVAAGKLRVPSDMLAAFSRYSRGGRGGGLYRRTVGNQDLSVDQVDPNDKKTLPLSTDQKIVVLKTGERNPAKLQKECDYAARSAEQRCPTYPSWISVVVFRDPDQVPWANDGSADFEFDAADFPEDLDTGSFLRDPKKAGSTRSSYRSSPTHAQHSRKFLALKPDLGEAYRDRQSSYWKPCDATKVKQGGGIYVVLNKFCVVPQWRSQSSGPRSCLMIDTLYRQRELVESVANTLPRLKTSGVLGLRAKDAPAVRGTEPTFIEFFGYLQQQFKAAKTDLKSLAAALAVGGIGYHAGGHLNAAEPWHESSLLQGFISTVAKAPRGVYRSGSEFQGTMKRWSKLLEKADTDWVDTILRVTGCMFARLPLWLLYEGEITQGDRVLFPGLHEEVKKAVDDLAVNVIQPVIEYHPMVARDLEFELITPFLNKVLDTCIKSESAISETRRSQQIAEDLALPGFHKYVNERMK